MVYDTLQTPDGCDSVVTYRIERGYIDTVALEARIFPGTSLSIGDRLLSEPGLDTVILQASHGCVSVILLDLQHYQVFVPNGFSPNHDGINDQFVIYTGAHLQRIERLRIYDRWGNKVFEGTDLLPNTQGWDGTYQGQTAATGVYAYVADFLMQDGSTHHITGSVTLLP